MKKLFSILITSLVFLSIASYADGMKPEQMAALKHASPMPNLMGIVAKNQEKLNITDKQKAALADWVDYSKPRVMKMVKTIEKLEKQLHDATLAGAPGSILQQIATQSLNIRSSLMKQKLACRNTLGHILNQKQIKQVVKLYTEDQS